MHVAEQTGCAEQHGGFVFLRDPKWGARERAQFDGLAAQAETMPAPERGWLCLPTGGTSGRLKFARHDEATFSASVAGICEYFGITRMNAVDVLPPYHVSSFAARVRCAATGGAHVPWSWKRLEAREFPEIDPALGGWVVSLVPTQLHRLLGAGTRALEWLHRFAIIFIGGGPVWPVLTEGAARARLPISLSYGMTETAAMVAALRPAEFLAGGRSSGRALPHACIEILDTETGAPLPEGETGLVRIGGESLFRGHFPETRGDGSIVTEDLGFFDKSGGLNIAGRRDATIITGGKKVQPGEVEAVLYASGVFTDVAVVGAPDSDWGQQVVACYQGRADASIDMARVVAALQSLAKYKWPKRYVAVPDWPRNAQGKVNRAALAELAARAV